MSRRSTAETSRRLCAVCDAVASAARRRARDGARRLAALRQRAVALFDGMNFRFLYDPQRQLFTIGYRLADARGARPARSVVLRSAGIRSAAGELPRDRQGRRRRIPLVPSGTSRDQRPRRAGPAVVERHDVRVSDAAARHAELSGHAARRIVPEGRAPPDGIRRRLAACRGASRSARTTSSTGTTRISTRRSASLGSV